MSKGHIPKEDKVVRKFTRAPSERDRLMASIGSSARRNCEHDKYQESELLKAVRKNNMVMILVVFALIFIFFI